jgi:hypothetical protein
MPAILSHWRWRSGDLAVVVAAWALVSELWFKTHSGWLSYVLLLGLWGGALAVGKAFRRGSASTAGTLVFDHTLFTAVWFGILSMVGRPVAFSPALAFFVLSLVVLLALRPLTAPKAAPAPQRAPEPAPNSPGFTWPVVSLWSLGLGLILSLGTFAAFGRWAAQAKYHHDFERIIPWIAPTTQYYPTASELTNIVRQRAKPGTILVICGGNSVLYGIGQPPARVWTHYLQQELGPRYTVVNLAIPGSTVTDGGAVIAEILRREYPDQIYLANVFISGGPVPGGSPSFRYLYWDARYKGLLSDDAVRDAGIARESAQPGIREGLQELKLRMRLDQFLYFGDAWNYLAYRKFGTVWGRYPVGGIFLEPRETRRDQEADYLSAPTKDRFPAYKDEAELKIVRGWADATFFPQRGADGKWQLRTKGWNELREDLRQAMPAEQKKHTLVLVSRDCPYYVQKLSPDDSERYELACRLTVQQWQEGGYEAFDYGRDFSADDYGDRIHLTATGGTKLAALTAVHVREMARKLGYASP